jgi:hypothetical protein
VVRAVGGVEQGLGAGVDVVAVQDRVAQQDTQLGAPWLTRQHDLAAEPGEPLAQQTGLRRLAGAVATLEGEEEARGTGGRDRGADEVERLSPWAVDGLLPALTVLLDLDPVAGKARLTGDPDRLERAGDEFHRRTREAFLGRAEAEPGRWLVLDATRPVDELAAAVRARVAALIGVAA